MTRYPSPNAQPLTTPSLVAPTLPLIAPGVTTSTPPLITPRATPPVTPPAPVPGLTDTFEHDPSYPSFITVAVIEHLNSVNGGFSWVKMVQSYLELEREYPSRVSHVRPLSFTPVC